MNKPNLLKSVARIQRAANRVSWLPMLMLEVTDRCDSRCNMCAIWKHTEKREPDSGRVERLVLGLKRRGLRHILITGGEPLVRQDIFEFCDRLSRHGVKLVLNTNGLRLEECANEVSGRFDLVIVSLDSHDRGVYEAIRGCDGLLHVVAGIKRLKEKGGRVMLSHTLQKRNIRGLADFIVFSKSLAVDSISVRPVDAFSRAFGRGEIRPGLMENLLPGEEDIVRFTELVETIGRDHRRDIRSGFLKPAGRGLRMIRDYFLACRGNGGFPRRECDMPFISLTVEAGGGVKPCFFLASFADISGVDEVGAMGIIRSRALAEMRRLFRKGGFPECRRCVQPYAADF